MAQAARGKTARTALRVLLCALTCAALALRLPRPAPAAAPILPDGAVWLLVLAALWLGYGAWLRLPRPFFAPLLWALAALFAGVVLLGQSYAALGTAELVASHPGRAAIIFGGRVPLYYAAMRLALNGLRRTPAQRLQEPVNGVAGQGRAPGAGHTAHRAAGLLLCWLPYLYFIFPGTVSNDSVTQVMEIIGVETLSNANPICQTALIYLFRGAGVVLGSADFAVALYCGLQALLMAWLLGYLLTLMAESAAPRWLHNASFAFYAFCPIFPLFAFCMGKDANFSMAVLWLSLTALRELRAGAEPGGPSRLNTLCLCLAGVLCTLLRNPGVYLALLTLALLLGWALLRRRPGGWRGPAAALASVLVVYASLHLLVIPSLNIAPMPETEHWSMPLQQTARVAATHPLTQEEARALGGVLELDRLAAEYNGELSDPVKFLWREEATAAQKEAFFRVWRRFLTKYPATCLSATFHNAYGYLYPGYMSLIKPTLLIGRQKRSTPEVEAAFGYTVNPRAEELKAFFNRLEAYPLYRVLISPGLYGWATLLGLTALLLSRPRRLIIAAVPALFSLAGCLLSAVNGYFRYAMPLYLCAPLLMWLCALSRFSAGSPSPAKEGKAL